MNPALQLLQGLAGRLCACSSPFQLPCAAPAPRHTQLPQGVRPNGALLGAAGAAREGLVTYTRLDAASQDAWAALRSSPAQEERPGSSAAAVAGSDPVRRLGSGPGALRGGSPTEGDPAGSRPTSQHVKYRGTANDSQLEAGARAGSPSSRGGDQGGPAGRVAAAEQGAAGHAASPSCPGSEPGNPEGGVSDAQQDAARAAASPGSLGAEPGSPEGGAGDAEQGAAEPAASPGSPGAMSGKGGEEAGAAHQAAAACAGHLSGPNPGARSPCDPAHAAPAAASTGPRSTERACGKRHARAADGMGRGKSATGGVDCAATAAADHGAAPAAKRQRAALAEDAAGASAKCASVPAGCAAAVEGAAAGNPAHAIGLLQSSPGGAALGAAGGSGSEALKGSARACEDAAVTVTLNAEPQGLAHGTKAPGGGGIAAAAGMPGPCRAGVPACALGRVHASAAIESVPDSVEGEGGGSPGGGEQPGDPCACAAEADQEANGLAKASSTPVEGAAAGSRPGTCPATASREQQVHPAEGAQASSGRAAASGSGPPPAAGAGRGAACASGDRALPQPGARAHIAGAAAACGGQACGAARAPGTHAPPSDAEVRELELAASQLHASPSPHPNPKFGSLDATAQLPRRSNAAGAAACGGGAHARACPGVGAGALPTGGGAAGGARGYAAARMQHGLG